MTDELIVKPHLTNALVPLLFKKALYSLIISILFFIGMMALQIVNFIDLSTGVIFQISLALFGLIVLFPVLIQLFVLGNTKYYFYKTHVVKEFKFFRVIKQSLPYHHIIGVDMDISIWDRICKAGDVTLHTAEDNEPDVVLYYIQQPEKVEKLIHRMIAASKRVDSQRVG